MIPDIPINNEDDDLLDFKGKVKECIKEIKQSKVDHSLSIGVISPWGTGKSSFLNLIREQLKKDSKHYLCIDFNPRESNEANNIQENFFNTVSKALKPYNTDFSSLFKFYIESLQLDAQEDFMVSFIRIFKSIDKDTIKDKISDILTNFPFKVVIFIEDLDRLFIEEIIEVFKLIDSNASFPNFIFITAYDKDQVNRMIKRKYVSNKSSFSDKFFDLEIPLPIRPYNRIHNYLVDLLAKKLELSEHELPVYRAPIDASLRILSHYLPTIRDVKRFVNLFIEDYRGIKGEVDFRDFFFLTIIKYKDASFYRKLYQNEILKKGTNNKYYFDSTVNSNMDFVDILELLFPNENTFIYENIENKYRKINSVYAFDIYFVTAFYNKLSKKEMNNVLNADIETARNIIDEWQQVSLIKDFIEYLTFKDIFNFSNKQEFQKYVQIIFYLSLKNYDSEIYLLIINLIYKSSCNDLTDKYEFKNQKSYFSFIWKTIKNTSNPYYKITQKLIINIIDGEFNNNPIIFSKQALLAINKYYLSTYIKNHSAMQQTHMELLYACISDIEPETRKIILDKEACKQIHDLIITSPQYYIKTFVRLRDTFTNPKYNAIVGEPFWKSIFKTPEQFKEFINNEQMNDLENIKRVQNFWNLYEQNKYKPLSIKGQYNVEDLINDDLNALINERKVEETESQ